MIVVMKYVAHDVSSLNGHWTGIFHQALFTKQSVRSVLQIKLRNKAYYW